MTYLVGRQFSHWTVIAQSSERRINGRRGGAAIYWLCRCGCGSEREVSERNLVELRSTSCGCSRQKTTKKLIDLSGNTYGRWTVIHRGTNRGENVYWVCRCSCSAQTERAVEARSLKGGRSTSCGCWKDEKASERTKGKPSGTMEDLTGNTYEKWQVLGLAERQYTEYGLRHMWNCRCECGSERVVDAATLRGGHSKSCGCSPYFNDLTGKTFGRLTVIAEDGRTDAGHVRWLCTCECGRQKSAGSDLLVGGKVGSCGCAKQEGIIVRPDHVRQKKQEFNKRHYREDIKFNLNRRMSAMIRLALRREGTEKGGRHWPDMVGYTVQELQTHLETTMPEGFTWDDYLAGKLHIDHIIPLAVHNYECHTDIDFQRAWALSNLRLLPGPENMQKNDRLDEPFQPSLLMPAA